jgi:TetR/AcrR family transcriptional regulator, cholesterol catabolism regulator
MTTPQPAERVNPPGEPSSRAASEETPHRILDEAQVLFSEWGYVGTTVQQIADRLGITKAALYYHFPQGKAEIFVELMRRHLRRFHAGLEEAIRSGDTVRARLEAMAEWIAAQAPAGDVEKLRRELIHIDEAFRAALREEFRSRVVQTIHDMLREGVERGELRDHDSEFVTWIFLNSACGVGGDCPTACSFRSDAPRTLVSLLLDGISTVRSGD